MSVSVTGSYTLPNGFPASGSVHFAALLESGSFAPGVPATLDGTGTFTISLAAGNYRVTERVGTPSRAPYQIVIPSAATAFSLTPIVTAAGGGFTPQETLILGPATGTFTDVTGTYVIPASATIIEFDGLGGGGGGASGSTYAAGITNGGGGGGGGGRTVKRFNAATLRALYPGGLPYTVGHGGQGGAAVATANAEGNPGLTGGYTYVGDFFVGVPGNSAAQAQGGGSGSATAGFPGNGGPADTNGGTGGIGGVLYHYYLDPSSVTSADGGPGGYPEVAIRGANAAWVFVNTQAGGGGGGGGGGGILTGVAGNGGDSGYGITAAPSPFKGNGGLVDSTPPTTCGATSIVTSGADGGGGGGASSITTNGQSGADGRAHTGGGGGGGGNSATGTSGAGGNAGSGFLRILVY